MGSDTWRRIRICPDGPRTGFRTVEKHGSVQSRKRYGHIPCLWLSCRTKNASKTFANIGSRHAQLLIAVCPRGGLGPFPVHVTIFCLLNIFRPGVGVIFLPSQRPRPKKYTLFSPLPCQPRVPNFGEKGQKRNMVACGNL